MTFSKKLILFLTAAVVCTGLSAQDNIKKRQVKQSKRIEQGIKSGELTKKETKKLVQGQKKVQQMKNSAKADGTVTRKEKNRIIKEQNKQSAKIYKQKHDKQKRKK